MDNKKALKNSKQRCRTGKKNPKKNEKIRNLGEFFSTGMCEYVEEREPLCIEIGNAYQADAQIWLSSKKA